MLFKSDKFVISLSFFFIASLIVIFYTLMDNAIFINQLHNITQKKIISHMQLKENELKKHISKTKDTLNALSKNRIFLEYLQNDKLNKDISDLFETVIALDKNIMQIRYIDQNGLEKIRFDRKNNKTLDYYIVAKLQNKADRYYFTNSIDKAQKVWFSNLDLNIEHGKVEIPFKPVYRAVLPIQQNDKFKGIVIINYFANMILEEINDSTLFDMTLVDSDGYILIDKDPKRNWSRFKEKPFKIEHRYLSHLNTKDIVEVNGKFIKRVDIPFANKLYLITGVSDKYQKEKKVLYNDRAEIVIPIFIFLMLTLSVILYLILKRFESNQIKIGILNEKRSQNEKILIQKTKMASMGEMIASIAHQWRQPLATISLHVTNLDRRYKKGMVDDKFVNDFIKSVNKKIDNMNTTIEDFSNFFKPNKQKEHFDIGDILNESIELCKDSLKSNDIQIELDLKEKLPYYGFKNELVQVLLNIINNAKDAIQINNIENGKIKIDIIKSTHSYKINIEDNAGGIDEKILNKLFEPYFTTKFNSNGTGIGLYMCKMIIEDSLKGSISIENIADGALCIITLPLNKEENETI